MSYLFVCSHEIMLVGSVWRFWSKAPTKKRCANGKDHVPVARFKHPKGILSATSGFPKIVSDSKHSTQHTETKAQIFPPTGRQFVCVAVWAGCRFFRSFRYQGATQKKWLIIWEMKHFLWVCDPKSCVTGSNWSWAGQMLLLGFLRAKCMACFKKKLQRKNVKYNAIGSLNFVLWCVFVWHFSTHPCSRPIVFLANCRKQFRIWTNASKLRSFIIIRNKPVSYQKQGRWLGEHAGCHGRGQVQHDCSSWYPLEN